MNVKVEGFQHMHPVPLIDLADCLCALIASTTLRKNYGSYMRGLPLFVCTFFMCFGIYVSMRLCLGGSTITSIIHGMMFSALRVSTGFVSYFITT